MNEEKKMNQQEGANIEIKDLIMRAIEDLDYKQLLINDPDKAMEDYELTDVQKMLIKSLRPEDLETLVADNLEELFSADSAVYTPDMEAEMETDIAEEDDI